MNKQEIHELVYGDFKENFETLFNEYTEYNGHTNISSIREKSEVFNKHFVDSLSILELEPEFNFSQNQTIKVLDLGTGGGFPAIPLAISKSNYQITALDSVGKKVKFVDQIKGTLQLKNIEVIKARAEELAHDNLYRESFDLVVSRAVAEMKILVELAAAFIKVGGFFVAYKKLSNDKELQEAEQLYPVLGLKWLKSHAYAEDRQLILLKKSKSSAKHFPRTMSQIKS